MKKAWIFCWLLATASHGFAQIVEAKTPAVLFEYCADHQFIAFGEAHGVACNSEIELAAIDFQLKKGRTVHFLMESGLGQEILINKYLFSEKSDTLIFKNARINVDFIEKLKRLHQKYPKKLFVHSIDAELSLMPFVEALLEASGYIEEQLVRKYLDKLSDYDDVVLVNRKEKNKYRFKIKQAVERLDAYLYFTNSTDAHLKKLVGHGMATFYLRRKRNRPDLRDAFLYENVQILLKTYPNDYFYLQVGGNHAFNKTDKKNYQGALCYRLAHEQNSLIKNKVFSIGMGLVNCQSNYWDGNLSTLDSYPIVIDSISKSTLLDLKTTTPTYKIYKPDGQNPFDLYLITQNIGAEMKAQPKNYLHLFRNKNF